MKRKPLTVTQLAMELSTSATRSPRAGMATRWRKAVVIPRKRGVASREQCERDGRQNPGESKSGFVQGGGGI